MEKTFLLKGLNNAYRFAQEKESIFREYNNEKNLVHHKIADLGEKRTAVFARFAAGHDKVKQLIDLALLANNMLKGKDLADFVKRSISLMK